MNKSLAFDPCGIEVSALTFIGRRRGPGAHEATHTFANTAAGHPALLRWFEARGRPVRVGLEATGLYGLDLALPLHQAGIPRMVANPRAVRHFAPALMQRSKNDRLDAAVLVEYVVRLPFQPWPPPAPAALKLLAVVRRLEDLTEMIAAEKNRQHAASLSKALSAAVRLDVAGSLRTQTRATNGCSPSPASAPSAPCRYWRNCCSWRRASTCGRGSPTLASTPGSIPRAAPSAAKLASARLAINICAAPSTCPPWWPPNTIPTWAPFTNSWSRAAKPKGRPWSPSCASSSTPSTACSNTTHLTTAPGSITARRSRPPPKPPFAQLDTQERIYTLGHSCCRYGEHPSQLSAQYRNSEQEVKGGFPDCANHQPAR